MFLTSYIVTLLLSHDSNNSACIFLHDYVSLAYFVLCGFYDQVFFASEEGALLSPNVEKAWYKTSHVQINYIHCLKLKCNSSLSVLTACRGVCSHWTGP